MRGMSRTTAWGCLPSLERESPPLFGAELPGAQGLSPETQAGTESCQVPRADGTLLQIEATVAGGGFERQVLLLSHLSSSDCHMHQVWELLLLPLKSARILVVGLP